MKTRHADGAGAYPPDGQTVWVKSSPDEDLYGDDTLRPSEEGLPPFDSALRPVQGRTPRQHCPPCARLGCPVRTVNVPRLPTQLELDWQHPIRGMELRNRLSHWVLWGSVAFWGALLVSTALRWVGR